MRNIRTFAAITAATATTLLTAAPADAALVPGARYDGVSGKPGVHQYATASKDGKRLGRYFAIADGGKCSDGSSYSNFIDQRKQRPTVIKADGSFDHPASSDPVSTGPQTLKRGKKRYRGEVAVGFSGTTTPDGNQITFTVSAKFVAKGLRCNAKTSTQLFRDGTPGAPFAGPLVNTATYPAAQTAGFTLGSFSAFAPGGELRGVDVQTTVKCKGFKPVATKFKYETLFLTPRGKMTAPSRVTGKTSDGYRYVSTDKLSLRFFRRGPQYAYSGTYSASLVFRRGAETIPCKTPAKKFAAVLPTG